MHCMHAKVGIGNEDGGGGCKDLAIHGQEEVPRQMNDEIGRRCSSAQRPCAVAWAKPASSGGCRIPRWPEPCVAVEG